jgi:hypothetical protein
MFLPRTRTKSCHFLSVAPSIARSYARLFVGFFGPSQAPGRNPLITYLRAATQSKAAKIRPPSPMMAPGSRSQPAMTNSRPIAKTKRLTRLSGTVHTKPSL